jgi:5'-3' exonuclease
MPIITTQVSQLKKKEIKEITYEDVYNSVRYGVIKSILNFKRKNNINIRNFVLCCDHGSWRTLVNPFYKKRRRDNKDNTIDWESFNDNMSIISNEVGDIFEIPVISIMNAEGDDVIASITMEYNDKKNIYIISSDKDFSQLLKYKSVKIYDPLKDEFISVNKPKQFLIDHIIMGDSTDDIPNIFNAIDFYTNTPINKKTGKPQRAVGLGATKLNEWFGDHLDVETKRKNLREIKITYEERYQQNELMINFAKIPDDIYNKIINTFKNKNIMIDDRKISRDKLFNYLDKYKIPDIKKDIQNGTYFLR